MHEPGWWRLKNPCEKVPLSRKLLHNWLVWQLDWGSFALSVPQNAQWYATRIKSQIQFQPLMHWSQRTCQGFMWRVLCVRKTQGGNDSKDLLRSVVVVQYHIAPEKEINWHQQKNFIWRFIKTIRHKRDCFQTQNLNDQTPAPTLITGHQNRLIPQTSRHRQTTSQHRLTRRRSLNCRSQLTNDRNQGYQVRCTKLTW